MITNGPITIYNMFIDPATEAPMAQRTELLDVYWYTQNRSIGSSSGMEQMNSYVIRIPQSSLDASERKYLAPKEWQRLDETARASFFTFQDDDIVVRGLVPDEISEDLRPKHLLDRYQDTATIQGVNDNRWTALTPHLKVVGA